jgi:hypothetical protein
MVFTDYLIPSSNCNLLALTNDEEGSFGCDSLENISSSDALEILPAPNLRESWFRIPGAIMKINSELGRVVFEGTPLNPSVRVTFERLDLNRMAVREAFEKRQQEKQ